MLLIERLAIVGELAATDFLDTTAENLPEPVRVGKALSGRGDDISVTSLEDRLRALTIYARQRS